MEQTKEQAKEATKQKRKAQKSKFVQVVNYTYTLSKEE